VTAAATQKPSGPPIPGVSRHARERVMERFGVEPAREEWLAAVLDILEGRALLMGRDTRGGKERFRLTLAGRELEVWWCTQAGHVTTVLPGTAAINPARVAQHEASRKGAIWGRADTRERYRPRYDMETAE
jgi:hypothetical protein